MLDEEAVARADKEMEERANRAKELLSQRYRGLKTQQVRTAGCWCLLGVVVSAASAAGAAAFVKILFSIGFGRLLRD
jgi:hypothetical protein